MLLYGFHKFIQYYCELYASVVKFKILNLKIFFAEWTTLGKYLSKILYFFVLQLEEMEEHYIGRE